MISNALQFLLMQKIVTSLHYTPVGHLCKSSRRNGVKQLCTRPTRVGSYTCWQMWYYTCRRPQLWANTTRTLPLVVIIGLHARLVAVSGCLIRMERVTQCLPLLTSNGIWDTQIVFRDNIIGRRCFFQIHQPFMIFTLFTTTAAFIIIFVAVEGYSQVSDNRPTIINSSAALSTFCHSHRLTGDKVLTCVCPFVCLFVC